MSAAPNFDAARRAVPSTGRGDNVVSLDSVRARKEAADSWDNLGAASTPPQQPRAPQPTQQQSPSQRQQSPPAPYKAWSKPQPNTAGAFPLPQLGPEHGTMKLWPGFRPIDKPGRCVACGFYVPTQLHRTYCPRTGQSADESQARHFRHLRN